MPYVCVSVPVGLGTTTWYRDQKLGIPFQYSGRSLYLGLKQRSGSGSHLLSLRTTSASEPKKPITRNFSS